jgi:flavin-dependent dehydrogenase
MGPSESSCDVAVIGAGPAGSMTAWGLASEGIDVTILDRDPFPRDKVCGDALLPDAVKVLEETGLATAVRREALAVPRAIFRSPCGRSIEVGGRFLTLRRERLDAILLEGAIAAGARFVPGFTVKEPIVEGGELREISGILDSGGPARLRCRLAVLCCGSNPRLLDAFGVLTRRLHSAIAIRGYLPGPPFPLEGSHRPALLISYEHSLLPGYGWAFPLPDGSWNVGCGVFLSRRPARLASGRLTPDLRALLDRFLSGTTSDGQASHPVPEGLRVDRPTVRGGTLRTGFGGAAPVRGPVLVAGEALGMTLPLTGDGIGKAMQSGLIAARTIVGALSRSRSAPDLTPYARTLEKRMRLTYRAYAAAQRWVRLPIVPDLIVRRAARSPSLRRLVEEIVAESTDPRALLSPLGLLRAVLL